MKIIAKTLVYLISIWLISVASLIHGYTDSPELCVVSSPLVTPYFTPWLDTPRRARGCSTLLSTPTATFFERVKQTNASRGLRPLAHDVHAVTLHVAPGDGAHSVELEVVVEPAPRSNDTRAGAFARLVLVLNSDRPVRWLLTTGLDEEDYKGAQPHVVLSEGSSVEANFNANVSHLSLPNKKSLHRYLKKTYKGVASYSEVKGANRLRLRVGARGKPLAECETNTQDDSPVLTAGHVVRLRTEGCFHEDHIGDNPMDVYVVELEGGSKNRNKRVGPHATLLPVMVQLLGEGTRPVPRNVTVVLKSHQPIRWQFGARRIHGNIVVVSDRDDQVENSSVDGHERLEVRFKKLPDNMVELLLSIKSEYGPPIMYAKTTHASTLQMVVGAKNNNKNGLRSGLESSVSHVMTDASGETFSREDGNGSKELMQQQPNLPPQPRHTGRQELTPVAQLTAAMRVHCGRTHFNVTFPAALVRRLGSPRLTLSDPVCAARYNKTHVTISSLVTSCGSTGHNDGKQFSNHVNVEFSSAPANTDDEDFEASGDAAGAADNGGQIPLVCKYQHFFPPNHDGDHDPDLSDHEVINSLYHMVVYRDKELKNPVLFKKKGPPTPIEVEFDQVLYVKAWIDGVVQVNVVTEQCWISNSSNSHLRSHVDLIRNTCPVDPSVELQTDGRSPYGFFSFRVSREYGPLGLVYLHCKLGVCTRDKLRINGQNESSIVCQDPQKYCSESLRMFLDKTVSTAQQLSSRGPFKPVLKPTSHSVPTVAPAIVVPASPSPQPAGGSCERVVFVGVATEVTIGIALLSFFMGVALTGALFCIHIKTDPFRRQRDKQRSTTSVGGSNGGTTASNG